MTVAAEFRDVDPGRRRTETGILGVGLEKVHLSGITTMAVVTPQALLPMNIVDQVLVGNMQAFQLAHHQFRIAVAFDAPGLLLRIDGRSRYGLLSRRDVRGGRHA
jgi:hypothetical protein